MNRQQHTMWATWLLVAAVLASLSATAPAADKEPAAEFGGETGAAERPRHMEAPRAETGRERQDPRRLPPLPPSRQHERDIMAVVLERIPEPDRERVMEFIRTEFHEEFLHFGQMSRQRAAEAVDFLGSLVRDAIDLLEAKRGNPDLYERLLQQRQLERAAHAHAHAARRSEGGDREEALQKLQDTLEEAFTIKQDLMQLELERLAASLEELRALIERRDQNRAAIIERRISGLTGGEDYLEW